MAAETSSMEPWQHSLLVEVRDIIDVSIKEFGSIITCMGLDNESLEEWAVIFKKEVQSIMDSLIKDVNDVKDTLVDRIEDLLSKSETLCKQLSIKMPAYGCENEGFYKEEQALRKQVEELQRKVDLRMQELDALKERQRRVCDKMGYSVFPIRHCPLPSAEEIDGYIKRIEDMEHEMYLREEKFITIKQEILELVNELEVKPSLEFEKMVLSDNDDLFMVTESNMKQLDNFHKSLIQQSEDVKNEICELREKARSLWAILEEDLQTCDTFLKKYPGNSLTTLKALKNEVKRLQELKKANIKVFVEKLRGEIVKLWEKCCFSLEERANFVYFHCDTYSEDLLSLHDNEIVKLKNYYQENSEIIELCKKREELWAKLLELEEAANQPNRYKNRGGQLLKEEKERNALSKRIPKLEEKLSELSAQYEIKYGKPFMYWDDSIENIIKKSYEEREQEKKTKLSARKQQRDLTTLTPGKSHLSVAGSHTNLTKLATPLRTPNGILRTTRNNNFSTNRKRQLATPLFSGRKKSDELKKHVNTAPPKVQVNGRTICKPKLRFSSEKKKRIEKMRRLSRLMQQQKEEQGERRDENLDYSCFEREVSSKDAGRSTTFNFDTVDTPLAVPLKTTPHKAGPSNSDTPKRTPRSRNGKLGYKDLNLII